MSGAVPKLRFPEFKEEWVARRVSEVGEVITGATPDTAREDFYGGTVPFYSPGDIPEVPAVIDAASKMLTDAGVNSVRRVPKGASLFVCIGSTIGKVAFAGAAGATNQQINSVVPSSANDPYFVFLTLQKVARRVRQFAGTQAVPIINKSEFSNEVVSSTTLPEQQKIASFLGAVDGKISGLRRKEAALVRFKAGLIQQLFSQKIRFTRDDGAAFPEWRETSLGSIGTTFSGLSGKSAADFGSGKAFVTYRQVFETARIDLSSCGLVSISLGEKQNQLRYGDILITTSSETPEEVGFASVFLDDATDVYLNSFCFGYRYDQTVVHPEFAVHLFRSPRYREKVVLLAQGSTRYNISKSGFLAIRLKFPHPDEQRKIADALSAIDSKINAVRQQISKMETFKKGLLQQMFV